MKMTQLVKVCMMVAMVAIVFAVYPSSSYGQGTSSTNGAMDPANPPVSYYNAAKGYAIAGAIVLDEPGGTTNVALGEEALASNTTGSANTASGYATLYRNTTAFNNTASGAYALSNSTGGNANTASGAYALNTNTAGYGNVASGYTALYSNLGGNSNVASGVNALYYNTTGSSNTASGYDALYVNTTGSYNAASGVNTCTNVVNGSNITCIGAGAGPPSDIPGPATYIAGIYGAATRGSGNPLVCIDSTGLLGTSGCASLGKSDAQSALIQQQQEQIQVLQKQNAEFQQRLARLESLIEKK